VSERGSVEISREELEAGRCESKPSLERISSCACVLV